MQKLIKPAKGLRYRAYFWLMNACTAAIIYSGLDPLVSYLFDLTIDQIVPLSMLDVVLSIIALFMFVVPMFLICAKFMRDEYAEGLWRRTSVVLAYATAGLPLIFLIIAWGWYFATGHTDAEKVHWSLQWMADEIKWGDATMIVWLGYMMVFVVIFQFLRWRDSQ